MKDRVLLVRVGEAEMRRAAGGVMITLVVSGSNIKVSVEDDLGRAVEYRRADLTGVKEPGTI